MLPWYLAISARSFSKFSIFLCKLARISFEATSNWVFALVMRSRRFKNLLDIVFTISCDSFSSCKGGYLLRLVYYRRINISTHKSKVVQLYNLLLESYLLSIEDVVDYLDKL